MSTSDPPRPRCARCGHPVRPDRAVAGYGRDCARRLGLLGRAPDTGHAGPDLLDLIDDRPPGRPGPDT